MTQIIIAKDTAGVQVELSVSDWLVKRLQGYVFVEIKPATVNKNAPKPTKKSGCGCGK